MNKPLQYISELEREYWQDLEQYQPGEEDGYNAVPPPTENIIWVCETNPRALISANGPFQATVWADGLGYTAYGKSSEDAIRRAFALQRGDWEEYQRTDA